MSKLYVCICVYTTSVKIKYKQMGARGQMMWKVISVYRKTVWPRRK